MAVDIKSCGVCGKAGRMQCSKCKAVKYCSTECQKKDWKVHKQQCALLAQAQLAGNGSAPPPAMSAALASAASATSAGAAADAAAPSQQDELAPVPKLVLHSYESFLEHFNSAPITASPTGLMNHGNTCYSNSVLQCLLHCRPLASYLLSKQHSTRCKAAGWCLLCELEKLALRARPASGPSSSALSVRPVVQNLRRISKTMRLGSQEDAHEFFVQVLDTIESSLLQQAGWPQPPPKGGPRLDARSRETTLLHHLYGGYVRRGTHCVACGHASRTFEPCLGLTLEMPGGVGSVEAALQAFFADEWLDEQNQYRCDKCKQHVRACRRAGLEVAPNVLMICLKRFGGQRFGKISRRISFGDRLDLSPHLVPGGMDAGPAGYSLFGVVEHLGGSVWGSSLGHYVTYIRLEDGRWYECDDEEVRKVSPECASERQPYLLFYTRDTPKPAPDPGYKPAANAAGAGADASSAPAAAAAAAAGAGPVMPRVETAPAVLTGLAQPARSSGSSTCSSNAGQSVVAEVISSTASSRSAEGSSGDGSMQDAGPCGSLSAGAAGLQPADCESSALHQASSGAGSSSTAGADAEDVVLNGHHTAMQQQQQLASSRRACSSVATAVGAANGNALAPAADGLALGVCAAAAGAALPASGAAEAAEEASSEDEAAAEGAAGAVLSAEQRARRNRKKRERLRRRKAQGLGEDAPAAAAAAPAAPAALPKHLQQQRQQQQQQQQQEQLQAGDSEGDTAAAMAGNSSARSSFSGEDVLVQQRQAQQEQPATAARLAAARPGARDGAGMAASTAAGLPLPQTFCKLLRLQGPEQQPASAGSSQAVLSTRQGTASSAASTGTSGSSSSSSSSVWQMQVRVQLPGVSNAADVQVDLQGGQLAILVPGCYCLPLTSLEGVPQCAHLRGCRFQVSKQQLRLHLEWTEQEAAAAAGSSCALLRAYSTAY